MPRYHFNVFDGVTVVDQEGTQLPNPDFARCEGVRLASELLRTGSSAARSGEEWRVEVTDGRGLVLFRIDIMLSESPAMR